MNADLHFTYFRSVLQFPKLIVYLCISAPDSYHKTVFNKVKM